jgi:hypothetical protein
MTSTSGKLTKGAEGVKGLAKPGDMTDDAHDELFYLDI